MKKQIANILSISRIIIGAVLMFFKVFDTTFLLLYLWCGFTDLIDGPIARKLNTTSVLGAMLDMFGDILMIVAVIKILLIDGTIPWWALCWFAVSLIGFVASAIIAKKKFNKLYVVHSLFCKLMGSALFLLPFLLLIKPIPAIAWVSMICIFSNIAAIETVIIQIKSNTMHTNVINIKAMIDAQKAQETD